MSGTNNNSYYLPPRPSARPPFPGATDSTTTASNTRTAIFSKQPISVPSSQDGEIGATTHTAPKYPQPQQNHKDDPHASAQISSQPQRYPYAGTRTRSSGSDTSRGLAGGIGSGIGNDNTSNTLTQAPMDTNMDTNLDINMDINTPTRMNRNVDTALGQGSMNPPKIDLRLSEAELSSSTVSVGGGTATAGIRPAAAQPGSARPVTQTQKGPGKNNNYTATPFLARTETWGRTGPTPLPATAATSGSSSRSNSNKGTRNANSRTNSQKWQTAMSIDDDELEEQLLAQRDGNPESAPSNKYNNNNSNSNNNNNNDGDPTMSLRKRASKLRYGSLGGVKGYVEQRTFFFIMSQRYLVLHEGTLTAYEDESLKKQCWKFIMPLSKVIKGGMNGDICILSSDNKVNVTIRPSCPGDYAKWWAKLNSATQLRIESFYKVGGVLGEGAFSQVRLAVDRRTGQEVAVKIMPKSRIRDIHELQRQEIQLMRKLNHPNIVSVIDVFQGPKRIYFVLEYVKGGMLYDYVLRREQMFEHEVKHIFKQILEAVKYCHEQGVVHRDLKLDNIMCTSKTWPMDIKITDFGLAAVFDEKSAANLNTFVGTPLYMAPELLLKKDYDESVDMWSCGVILFGLLTGSFPFKGSTPEHILESIRSSDIVQLPERFRRAVNPTKGGHEDKRDSDKGAALSESISEVTASGSHDTKSPPKVTNMSMPEESETVKPTNTSEATLVVPDPISESALSLIRALLQKEPKKRLSASAALCHPWLAEGMRADSCVVFKKRVDSIYGGLLSMFPELDPGNHPAAVATSHSSVEESSEGRHAAVDSGGNAGVKLADTIDTVQASPENFESGTQPWTTSLISTEPSTAPSSEPSSEPSKAPPLRPVLPAPKPLLQSFMLMQGATHIFKASVKSFMFVNRVKTMVLTERKKRLRRLFLSAMAANKLKTIQLESSETSLAV